MGAIAAVAIIVACILVFRQLGGSTEEPAEEAGVVTMICRDCGEVFKITYKDMGLEEHPDLDALQEKATGMACPKCGKKNTVVSVRCPRCGKPFAPPTDTSQIRDFKCPHCKKSPWKR